MPAYINIRYYWDLISVMVEKDMKVRYRNSYLGYFWSIAHPMAFALVFFIAFKVVMRIQVEDYPLFLIAGLFPWQWFANTVNAAPVMFSSNAPLIKKLSFPRSVIPLAAVAQDSIHFLLSVPVIMVLIAVYGRHFHLSWLYLMPPLLLAQIMLASGTALAIATLNLFFRDLERLTNICVSLLFYFTPVIYSADMVPQKYRIYIKLNPVAPLMICWRAMFMDGKVEPSMLLAALGYSAAVFCCGYWIYRRLSWKFAEIL